MSQHEQKNVLLYRDEMISALQTEEYDLVVVGGGITGAGVARDAAIRGYSVALVDKADYGYGTSSGSSKLVHAGLRYVGEKEFRLVREASKERKKILEMAPHLTQPRKFLVPLHSDTRTTKGTMRKAVWLYDLLANFRNHTFHKFIGIKKAQELLPQVKQENFQGAVLYGDGQMDDARLTLEVILSAVDHGAKVLNYCEVENFTNQESSETTQGVLVHDKIGGHKFPVKAKVVVIACGSWTDQLLRVINPDEPARIRPTKGIHIITKRFYKKDYALVVPVHDGRVIFIVPFGQYNLIGTTDTDYSGDLDNVSVSRGDVIYLVNAVDHIFPGILKEHDIVSAYSGLRPLIISPEAQSESEVSRKHEIFELKPNLFAIAGGKYTTYRTMAKEIVDQIGKFFGKQVKCQTDKVPLRGWGAVSRRHWKNWIIIAVEDMTIRFSLPQDVAHHLLRYGENYKQVCHYLEEQPGVSERISAGRPYILAEVDYAVKNEHAITLNDFMFRRSQLQLSDQQGLDCVERVARRMAYLLAWSADKEKQEIETYQQSLVWYR